MLYRSLFFTLVFFLFSCSNEKEKSAQLQKSSPKKSEDIPLFEKISYSESGVDFINKLTPSPQVNILTFKYFYNGGGVAVGDVNNDQLMDLYLSGNTGPNRLFLNKGGFKFEDITRSAGVDGGRGWSNGVNMVDINNDGWLDIYVCRSGNFNPDSRRNQLFINNGDGTFTDQAKMFGLDDPGYSTHSTFFDYDRDGDLDMYLLNHNIEFGNRESISELKNKKDSNVGDKLFRNDNGRFVDVSNKAGIKQTAIDYGLGVGIGDLNEDGFPDIYVCNDFMEKDYLYINNGDGSFSDKLESSVGHTSNYSMGVDIADYNNDGMQDILVADMAAEDNYRSKTNMSGMNPKSFWKAVNEGFHYQYMVNTLQLNRGENQFSEIGHYAGVAYTDWSWSPLFADLNNDGWKDLFITNGYRQASRNNDFLKKKDKYYEQISKDPNADVTAIIKKLLELMPEDKLPNYAYKNNKDLTFTKSSKEWGLDELSFSNGSALADLDNDGDLDIIINNIDQACSIYKNNADKVDESNFIRIKLNGSDKNKNGIGTTVKIKTDNLEQNASLYPSRGYLSSSENILHFGIGPNQEVDELQIIWPDQKIQIIEKIKANQLITLHYSDANQHQKTKQKPQALFTDITQEAKLNFMHQENSYDDFEDEILLPHKMSTLGPGTAVGDINNDGLEDFFVGGAKGQPGVIYLQNSTGTFTQTNKTLLLKDKRYEDMGAAFFDLDNDSDLDLYVSSGGSEEKEGSSLLQDRMYINDGKGNFSRKNDLLPNTSISNACVVPYDFDKDGDVDVFIGGRMVPGKYPSPTSSSLLQNNEGKLVDVTKQLSPDLVNIGMVTTAEWADINNDGETDLVLAGEWMPIQVLLQHKGQFTLQKVNGLENTSGWWFSLKKVDIDNDGDLDFIAGNLGLNYKYKTSILEPFQVYYHDFDSNGTNDIYLGQFKQGNLFPVRGRECSSQQMPFVKEKFETYDAFAKASLKDVIGKAAEDALHYEAQIFASCIIENKGNGNFEWRKLPAEAQFSSVNGIVIEDLNGDSFPDILLAGNLHGSEVETPRNDASYGTSLLNERGGSFSSIDMMKSGFNISGDVKAIEKIVLSNGETAILAVRNNDKLSLLKLNNKN